MTLPLVVLSLFAIGYGWVGIPEHFPGLGGLVPNWFHEFVGSTLAVLPEAAPFNLVPLLTSLAVALGGLLVGWWVYRAVKSPEQDLLQIPVLKNKWYFDEIYDFVFIKPAIWFAETFVSQWMDKGLIDGILHSFGRAAAGIGSWLRNVIDKPVINGFFGDGTSEVVKWTGRSIRPVQSGRIQQYMVLSLIVILALAGLVYYFLMLRVG
jgi:NADH-quinone oxidoreductase subunit L